MHATKPAPAVTKAPRPLPAARCTTGAAQTIAGMHGGIKRRDVIGVGLAGLTGAARVAGVTCVTLLLARGASAQPRGADAREVPQRQETEPARQVHDGQWHDAARLRDIAWRLRLPTTPGPWPLVAFSHGLGGSRDGAEVWGEAWCTAGLAVLHIQHPGSDSVVAREGIAALRRAATAQQLLARVADLRFVLDEMARAHDAGQAPWRSIRLDALGLSGHSFGAHTTLALAGQRYAPPAASIRLADARWRAFIAFSPSVPPAALRAAPAEQGGEGAADEALQHAFGAIEKPCLLITGSLDGDPFGSYADGAQRARVFDGLPAGQRALLWLDGADHMSFAGIAAPRIEALFARRSAAALEREAAHHAAVARVSTLWWRAHLLHDAPALEQLRQAAPVALGPADRWTFR